MELQTSDHEGELYKKARVTTNDPENQTLVIGLKGVIWVPVHMRPPQAHLRGVVGEPVEKKVIIEGSKGKPLSVELTSVTIPEMIEVDLKEVEKDLTYEMAIKNKMEAGGVYNGWIRLKTNYPEKPELFCGVSGQIGLPVEVSPKTIHFGTIRERQMPVLQENATSFKRAIVIVLNKGEGLTVDRWESEESLYRVDRIEEIEPGRKVRLFVEPILDKVRKGKNTDRLKIYTNQNHGEMIEVPLQFEVL